MPAGCVARALAVVGVVVATSIVAVAVLVASLGLLDTTPIVVVWLGLMLVVAPLLVFVAWRRKGRLHGRRWQTTAIVAAVALLLAVPARGLLRADRRPELRSWIDVATADSATFTKGRTTTDQTEPGLTLGDVGSSPNWEVCRTYDTVGSSPEDAIVDAAARLRDRGFVDAVARNGNASALVFPEHDPEVRLSMQSDDDSVAICAEIAVGLGADRLGADCARAQRGETNLAGADLSNCNLAAARLSGADASGASLQRADLRRADLSGADLAGANLSGAKLDAANLVGIHAPGAMLAWVTAQDANLGRADLRAADLNNADLRAADLSGANLTGADLTSANLGRARLTGASLVEADLWNANLSKADLTGADLAGATFRRTTCPDGVSSDRYAGCVGHGA